MGIGKREYYHEELGCGTVEEMKMETIGPLNLFNPGKVYFRFSWAAILHPVAHRQFEGSMTFELLDGAGERGFLTYRIFGDHRGDYRYIPSWDPRCPIDKRKSMQVEKAYCLPCDMKITNTVTWRFLRKYFLTSVDANSGVLPVHPRLGP